MPAGAPPGRSGAVPRHTLRAQRLAQHLPGRGALLLLAYAVGLGVPFLVLAAGVARGGDRFRWLRRHARRIEIVGGIALVLTGVLMMSGGWTVLMSRMLAFYARLGWPPI